jgi:hypothetical protein
MSELFLIVATAVGLGVPGYVIGKRRGLTAAWVAFIPFVGLWVVLFRSVGRGAWWLLLLVSLIVLVPFVGLLVASIWMGLEVPARHGRSSRWTAVLVVPVVNYVGYWFYAFTLPTQATPGSSTATPPPRGAVSQ